MNLKTEGTEPGRVLRRLKRLRREGNALLAAATVDQMRYGRWCQRVERALSAVFVPPLDYRGPSSRFIERPQSPLDVIAGQQPFPSIEDGRRLRDARSKKIIKRWMLSLASALERLELRMEACQ